MPYRLQFSRDVPRLRCDPSQAPESLPSEEEFEDLCTKLVSGTLTLGVDFLSRCCFLNGIMSAVDYAKWP